MCVLLPSLLLIRTDWSASFVKRHHVYCCFELVLLLRYCFIRDLHTEFESPHPELLLNGAGVGLGVQAVHVVVDGAQLTGRDGGVATETRLQDGVVDEDILLLQKTASSLRIYKTSYTYGKRDNFFLPSRSGRNASLFLCLFTRSIQ